MHATCEKIVLHSGSGLKVYYIFIILCDPLTCNPKCSTSITLEIRLTIAKHITGSFYLFQFGSSVTSVVELQWLATLLFTLFASIAIIAVV